MVSAQMGPVQWNVLTQKLKAGPLDIENLAHHQELSTQLSSQENNRM
jgi:hypothetical protein